MSRADYGIDAPLLLRNLASAGLLLFAAAAILTVTGSGFWTLLAALPAIYLLGLAGLMIYESRRGKVIGRERWLDLVPWRGDERVLDAGCGHGLLLVGVAHRVPHGRAIGIDLWLEVDQAGNRPEVAMRNAVAEKVADRVEIQTGNICSIPFADASFDVVLTHWVIHNLKNRAERATALAEFRRVLRPRGRLILVDIALHEEYLGELGRTGWDEIRLAGNNWRTRFLAVVSAGHFCPMAVVARRTGL